MRMLIDRSSSQCRADAIEVLRSRGHILTPVVRKNMKAIEKAADEFAKRYPNKEYTRIYVPDLLHCIKHGEITDVYPLEYSAGGRIRLTYEGQDTGATCRLIIHVTLPRSGSTDPLTVEDFSIAPSD